MKKLVLAAFLAVPLLAMSQQKAAAQCTDLPQWLRYKFCTCLNAKCGHGASGHGACGIGGCGPGGCGVGGYGMGGYGCGSCYRTWACSGGCGCGLCGVAGLLGCNTKAPGPWYLYWPYDGQRLTLNGYGPAWPGGWNYEWHFQVATPWGAPPPPVAFPAPSMAPGVAEAP